MTLQCPPETCNHKRAHLAYTPEDRLRRIGWTEVQRVQGLSPCWEWKGLVDKRGYGRVAVEGRRMAAAHRVAYEVWNGGLDPSLYVLHRCDNPACMRPEHLFQGDQFDNMADCHQKRRTANGERQGSCKLTDEQVAEIRSRWRPFDRSNSQRLMAKQYGVSLQQISNIIHRRQRVIPTN